MANVNDISLYGITQELEALEEIIAEDAGEVSEATEALIMQVEHMFATKTDNVVGFVEKQEDMIKLADEKIKALQDFKKAKKNQIERIKDYVRICIEKTSRDKFVGELNSIKLTKPRKIVEITEENAIPAQYLRIVPETIAIDKTKLAKALKEGEEIPGAKLVDSVASVRFGLNKGK